jgi:hypothetical protein
VEVRAARAKKHFAMEFGLVAGCMDVVMFEGFES